MTNLYECIPSANIRMSMMYFLLCYMFITISPVYAARGDVFISYTSLGSPDFYLNDEVTITCAATGFSDIDYLKLIYSDMRTRSAGCEYEAADRKWNPVRERFIGDVDGLDSPPTPSTYCELVGKAEGFSISVKVTVIDGVVGGLFFCRAYDGTPTSSDSRKVYVASVKVAPANLTMSMPEEVIEGEEFEVKCESTGADPVSTYKYAIWRYTTSVAVGSTYTPTKWDREGITVMCTDTAHPNWIGGNTVKTTDIQPKYIDIVEESIISVEFNPLYSTSELHCGNYVTGIPVPDIFRWERNGSLDESSGSTLALTPRDDVGVVETVECTAENGIGKSVTVTWNIRWNSDVTTTPDTTPTPATSNKPPVPPLTTTTTTTLRDTPATSNKPPVAAIVGGVVGGAAILIIIINFSIYCWRNKKDRRRRQAPADAVTSDHTELATIMEIHEYATLESLRPVNRVNDTFQNLSSPNFAIIPPVPVPRNQNYGPTDEINRGLYVLNPHLADVDTVQDPYFPNNAIIPPVTVARNQNYGPTNEINRDLYVLNPYLADVAEA